MSEYAGLQLVGMDLHRRRSVIVRMTEAVIDMNDACQHERESPACMRVRSAGRLDVRDEFVDVAAEGG